jgi:phage terminase large subunit-like protein
MILTDGGAGEKTDYNYILKYIYDLRNKIDVKCLAFDPWNAWHLIHELRESGLKCEEYGQLMKDLSFPTKQLEGKILAGELIHNGNPCMAWMMRNVQLMYDSNDNYKIDKKRSTEKVDGPASAAMAIGQWIAETKFGEVQYIF